MALNLSDRVRDTTATIGTGTITLSGAAPTGYQTFETGVGNGNTTYYTINSGNNWEVGIGTYSSTGPTLTRDTVLASSASGAKVDFPAGTKDVFVTYPAERSVYQDGSSIKAGTATLGVANGGTGTATQFTAGSVVFAGTSGVYTQDNANLFWDDTNNRLGIGTSSPGAKLSIGPGNINLTDLYALNWGVQSTYIYGSSSTGTIKLATSNTDRLTVDASGYVGIGTTSPSPYKLNVSRGSQGQIAQFTDGVESTFIISTTSGLLSVGQANPLPLALRTDNTERMRITSVGDVLIGTTSGGYGLTVVPRANVPYSFFNTASAGYGYSAYAYNGSAYAYVGQASGLISGGGGTNTDFAIRSENALAFASGGGTERMRIDTSGNVGVGTSSPSSRVHIQTAAGTAPKYWIGQSATSAWSVGSPASVNALTFIDEQFSAERARIDSSGNLLVGGTSNVLGARVLAENASGNQIGVRYTGIATYYLNATSGGDLGFNKDGAERMRIDSSGNVGIGTSSPSGYRLRVYGSNDNSLLIDNDTSQYTSAWFANNGTNKAYISYNNSSSDFTVGNITASGSLLFVTNSTEKMRIDSSGNVGIGTSSPSTRLDVASAAGSTTAYTALFRSTNTNGYSGLIGIGVAPATAGAYTAAAFAAENSNGTATDGGRLKFYTAAEDASHTLTERMRIDSAGNVGIGTSNPLRKLDIAGGGLAFTEAGGASRSINWGDTTNIYPVTITGNATSGNCFITFNTNTFGSGATERARIDSSGNLLVGLTSGGEAGIIRASGGNAYGATVTADGGSAFNVNYTGTGTGYFGYYKYGGTLVGSISSTGTTTSFNTSSDARLKHDIVDAPEASSLIDAIKVRSFKWNADNSEQRYGMVAQELIEVAPEAVSVPADEDQMMGVDYSKLVPMLVKEIQSLRARVAQLEGN